MKRIRTSRINLALELIILISCAMMLIVSCKTHKSVVTIPTKDSTYLEVREHIVHMRDTIYFEIPAEKVSNEVIDSISYLETDYAESYARISADGRLTHTLSNKTQSKPHAVTTPIIYKDSIIYRSKPVPYPVERELSGWEQLKIDMGGKAMAGCAVFAIAALIMMIRHIKRRR